MAASANLGLAHPPGNPFFMLLGHLFGLFPFSESYAVRLNMLSAFASAVAAGFWFLVTERILVSWFSSKWERVVGGVLASIIGATAFTVWNQSVVSEKVYSVSLAFFAVVSWIMIRWADKPDAPKADRFLLLVGFLLGLGYTVHPAGFLAAPAVVAVVAFRRPLKFLQTELLSLASRIVYGVIAVVGLVAIAAIFGWIPVAATIAVASLAWMRAKSVRRFPLVLMVVGVVGLGLTAFAYLPIRAAWFPKMNSGEPTACTTEIGFSCTFSKATYQKTLDHINREQYGQKLERHAPYVKQVAMWWLYFKWQWMRDLNGVNATAQYGLAAVFLSLGILGGYVHWRRDRSSFLFFGPLVFTMTLALIYYLNFKFGASQSIELGNTVEREVRDRDYFFIWSFSAWGVWTALGLTSVWQYLAKWMVNLTNRVNVSDANPSRRSMLFASPVLAIAFIPLFANWSSASRADETFTLEWARDMLNSIEPYGILITYGDNKTYPLWYAQEAEGIRKDVTVVVTSYLNMNWALRQLVRNPVHEYNPLDGPQVYQNRTWPRPETPPLNMSFNDIESLPPYMLLSQPQRFQHGSFETILPEGVVRQDQLVILRMIKDVFPDRPIFFSSRFTNVGAERYLVATGLAYKLMPQLPQETTEIRYVDGGYIDIDTTLSLWENDFRAPEALIAQKRWTDPPSLHVPLKYATTGLMLASGLHQTGEAGDKKLALKVEKTVRELANVAGIERYFRGLLN